MPDVKVVSPAAVVPADRLTLGSCDARVDSGADAVPALPCSCSGYCMAEE